jgi:hypothetical protein
MLSINKEHEFSLVLPILKPVIQLIYFRNASSDEFLFRLYIIKNNLVMNTLMRKQKIMKIKPTLQLV